MPPKRWITRELLRITALGLLLGALRWILRPDWSVAGAFTTVASGLLMMLVPAASVYAVVGGIMGTLALARRWFPSRAPALAAGEDTQAAEHEEQRIYWVANLAMWVSWPVLGVLAYFALAAFADWRFAGLDAVYVVPIDRIYWALPAGVAGMWVSMVWIQEVLRLALGERYVLYEQVYERRMGVDNRRLGRAMGILFGLLFLGMLALGLSTYTRFTTREIASRSVLRLAEEVHTYRDVSSVQERLSPGPRQTADHVFVITFTDGREWRTTSYHDGEVPADLGEIMAYVARQSGQPFERVVETGR